MTADAPTPTPPEDEPRSTPDPADAQTARHEPPPAPDPDPVAPPAGDDPGRGAPAAGLYRSTHDRMLAGVCGGIAERYGIDTVLVRLAFLASLLIGGAGVLFYVAAAIVIPNPPVGREGAASGPVPPTTVGSGILRIVVALAVALGVFCGLATVACVAFAGTVFLGPWPAAVVLVVLGALLAAVAQNRRSAATVLVLLVAVAAPASAAVIADLSVDRSVGERTEVPTLPEDAAAGYRLGVGSLTVDLRQLPLRAGSRPLRVPVRVDAGRAAIVIPDDRCVAWTIRTKIGFGGDVRILDYGRAQSSIGSGETRTFRINPGGGPRRPQVTIDAHVGLGEIVVGTSIRQIERYLRTTDTFSPVMTKACRGSERRR